MCGTSWIPGLGFLNSKLVPEEGLSRRNVWDIHSHAASEHLQAPAKQNDGMEWGSPYSFGKHKVRIGTLGKCWLRRQTIFMVWKTAPDYTHSACAITASWDKHSNSLSAKCFEFSHPKKKWKLESVPLLWGSRMWNFNPRKYDLLIQIKRMTSFAWG